MKSYYPSLDIWTDWLPNLSHEQANGLVFCAPCIDHVRREVTGSGAPDTNDPYSWQRSENGLDVPYYDGPTSGTYITYEDEGRYNALGDELTMCCWMQSSFLANQYIFTKNYGGTGVSWFGLTMNTSGRLTGYWDDGSDSGAQPGASIQIDTGEPVHLTLTNSVSANSRAIYVNGVQDASASGQSGIENTGDYYVGARADDNPTRDLEGLVWDCRVYDRALDVGEILRVANNWSDLYSKPRAKSYYVTPPVGGLSIPVAMKTYRNMRCS